MIFSFDIFTQKTKILINFAPFNRLMITINLESKRPHFTQENVQMSRNGIDIS